MASIRIYLRKSTTIKDAGTLHVYVIFSRDNILRYPTGEKCLVKDWNPLTQRLRPCDDQAIINERLEDLTAKITDILGTWRREGVDPDVNQLRNLLLQYAGKRIASGPGLTLLECVNHQGALLKSKGNKGYRYFDAIGRHLKNYEKLHGKVLVEKIGMEFLQNWVQYFQIQTFADGRYYSKNYLWGSVQLIRGVLRAAKDRGEKVNPVVFTARFKSPGEQVLNIYLNEEKLQKIATVPLLGHLERTRDLFIIQSFTGIRYSDISSITMNDIKDGCLDKIQHKTFGRIVVPLHPLVQDIITKYKGKLPTAKANVNMNLDLRVIGEAAGLTDQVTKVRTEGGKRVSRTFFEWQLIQTHTGRRSFCTNAYLAGVPILSIMACSGHKTITSFMRYVRVGEKEIAESLKNHDFFKGSSSH